MRHLEDAKRLIDEGDGHGALEVIEGVMALAPRNPEALRLKAQVLEAWGHFDESLAILRDTAEAGDLSADGREQLANHLREEREFLLFSVLAQDGRWYFAMPHAQVRVSWFGLLGCLSFLLLATTNQLSDPASLPILLLAFAVLVLGPWFLLMIVFLLGVKKVFVGMDRLEVHTRFVGREILWRDVRSAVVVYDPDPTTGDLRLLLYGTDAQKPLAEFDVSESTCVVRARRHFFKHVLMQVGVASWCPKTQNPVTPAVEFHVAAETDEQPATGNDRAAS